MIYMDYNSGELKIAQDDKTKFLYAFLQELLLFKEENPLNIKAGIDYLSIFNYQKFFISEFTELARKHQNNFKQLELQGVEQSEDKLKINILIVHLDETADNQILELNL